MNTQKPEPPFSIRVHSRAFAVYQKMGEPLMNANERESKKDSFFAGWVRGGAPHEHPGTGIPSPSVFSIRVHSRAFAVYQKMGEPLMNANERESKKDRLFAVWVRGGAPNEHLGSGIPSPRFFSIRVPSRAFAVYQKKGEPRMNANERESKKGRLFAVCIRVPSWFTAEKGNR